MSVNRNLRMDNAKGILIMLVVIGHFLLPLQGRTRVCTNLFYEIYVFHMAAFTFISGLFSQNIYIGKDKKIFNGRKLFRNLWLYVVFEIIVFFSEIPAYGRTSVWPDLFHEEGAPWYLLALFIWYIFIPFWDFLDKRIFKASWMTFILILMLSLAGGYIKGLRDFMSLERIIAFAPFFYAGHFWGAERMERFICGEYPSGDKAIWYGIEAIAIFSVLTIGLFMYDRLLPYHDTVFGVWYERFRTYEHPECFTGILRQFWLLRFIWYIAAGAMTLGFLKLVPACSVPALTVMGQRTLQIYILHRPVRDLFLATGLITSLDPGKPVDLIIVLLFCVILSIVLSMSFFTILFKVVLLPFKKK